MFKRFAFLTFIVIASISACSAQKDSAKTIKTKRVNFDLRGRQLLYIPSDVKDNFVKAVVVVEIVVDATGKVIMATPGAIGTTNHSSVLLAKARLAALSAKFSKTADIHQQKGTLTIVIDK